MEFDEAQPRYQELVSDLADDLDISSLEPDEDGACALELDEGLVVIEFELSASAGQIAFSSIVGELSGPESAQWYPRLLEANAFFVGTGGATLGVIQPTDMVVMAYQEPVRGLTSERFIALFHDFANAVRHWQSRLQEEPADNPPLSANQMSMLLNQRV